MRFLSWLRHVKGAADSNRSGQARRRPRPRKAATPYRLWVEVLEGRTLLSFTVNTTADSGEGSLRWAIESANANLGQDTIDFAIGSGVQTITPLSPLPDILDAVIIQGMTQPGFAGSPLIELNGSSAGEFASGLVIRAADCWVQALVINRFSGAGIELSGPGADRNVLCGNYIGTSADGNADVGNGRNGVFLNGASGNTVDGNLISGNDGNGVEIAGSGASGNLVSDNQIGVSEFDRDLGNGGNGVLINGASNNTIGGGPFNNVISGNDRNGVEITGTGATGNWVFHNKIGTDLFSHFDLGNSLDGVFINGASGNTVGGTIFDRNVISRNGGDGVEIAGSGATGNLILGNFIGTDDGGSTAMGNTGNGVFLNGSGGNTVGSMAENLGGNLISGNNRSGVEIAGAAATGNVVLGNRVGTNYDGSADLGNGLDGVLLFGAPNNTVGGTTSGARNVISANDQNGVEILGIGATGNLVAGNYLGTNAAGTADLGNSLNGVLIFSAAGNTVGGTAAGARNVISGNDGDGVGLAFSGATGNVVLGNYLGTNLNGTADLGNTCNGVYLNGAPGNTVGGTVAGSRNLISGNDWNGVEISFGGATANLVVGNYVGTNAAGSADLGNSLNGVFIDRAAGNTVGGASSAARNLISGNNDDGVEIAGTGASGNLLLGNYVGTNAAGTADLGNTGNGVFLNGVANNTIGGSAAAAARNVISGNDGDGVEITGSCNVLLNNRVGTNAGGTADLGNSGNGVFINGGANNTIGGTAAGARNLISGNDSDGIEIAGAGASGNLVLNTYVGTDAAGFADLGNSLNGVYLNGAPGNTVGGTTSAARNVIAGNNSDGVEIALSGATGNRVLGNYVGTAAAGTADLGNTGNGVFIRAGAARNTIGGTTGGARNVISGNDSDGVEIAGSSTTGNLVQGNYLGTDRTGSVDLGNTSDGVSLNAPGNTIGGTTAGARNVISGNNRNGVGIEGIGATANLVVGNYVGTSAAGTADLGNSLDGVYLGTTGNTVGGTTAGARNLISGNDSDGIQITGSTNVVLGNYVGTDAAGTADLGNTGNGVLISGSRNTVGGTAAGARNLISGNDGDGVSVTGGTRNTIRRNSLFANTGLGIDLGPDGVTPNDPADPDAGANDLQNHPVLTQATTNGTNALTLTGSIDSTPNTVFMLEVYASAAANPTLFGEGETYLGTVTVTTDAAGMAVFQITLAVAVPAGRYITVTATKPGRQHFGVLPGGASRDCLGCVQD